MKLIPALLISLVTCQTMAQETQPFQEGTVDLHSVIQRLLESSLVKRPVGADTKDTVQRKVILGPTGELLPPALATRQLRGKDYFEWCQRWNKQQYLAASRRAVPATTIRGHVTRQASFVEGVANSGFFRRGSARNVTSNSTTDTRKQMWQVGGYGGSPVELYNPFISDAALKAITTLPQPTAFNGLIREFDGECSCCRRKFQQAD